MLVSAIALALALAMALLLASGRLDWWMAWIYIGVRVGTGATSMLWMAKQHPAVLEERFHPGEGAKGWDSWLGGASTLLSLVTLVVAGLDARFAWSPPPVLAVQLVALLVFILADAFSKWAAAFNPFYSRVVRIQDDRGHTVVTDGPYHYVRHPGYAGGMVAGAATPAVLGSLWALCAAGMLVVVLAVRTALEDRGLHAELRGYADYARRTRFRLVPGVW